MKKYLICLSLIALHVLPGFSQNENQINSLNEGNIDNQFDYVNRISNNYQEYKVVKRAHLEKLRTNVLDSIRVYKTEISEFDAKISERDGKISSLQQEITQTQEKLETAEAARDNFEFLGMPIGKAAFTNMMGTIIGILTVAFLFFLFKYSQSHKIISKTKKDLDEALEEFDQHRKNTLERERKLKRELVDALNGKTS